MFRLILSILPPILRSRVSFLVTRYKRKKLMIMSYKYDLSRYLDQSENIGYLSKDNLIGLIVRQYHVIEKGLSMPDMRLGFGVNILKDLIKNCINYFVKYDNTTSQVQHAIHVINEYFALHTLNNYKLSNDLLKEYDLLKSTTSENIQSTQLQCNNNEFFEQAESDFYRFSFSRHSVRNFSETEVSADLINNALKIAQNAPSACNRQSWRVRVYSDKRLICSILDIQGGSRGFGHLANKLLLVTGKVSHYSGANERNAVYVDGGIYTMNLAYALHYNKIASCILNASFDVHKDLKMRNLLEIDEDEVFITILIVGYPPATFKVASSPRLDYSLVSKYI